MAGGGGTAGAVDFPVHMKEIHQDWLGWVNGGPNTVGQTVNSTMQAAFLTNPYESLAYDDPATNLGLVVAEYNSFNTYSDQLNEVTDYNAIIGSTVAQLQTAGYIQTTDVDTIVSAIRTSASTSIADAVDKALLAIDDTVLINAVERFVSSRRLDRARLRSRYKAQSAVIGAERGSAYAIGLALLESEFEKETSDFQQGVMVDMYSKAFQGYLQLFSNELQLRVQADLESKRSRNALLSEGIRAQLQYKQFIVSLKETLVRLMGDVYTRNFQVDSEYVGNTADLNRKHAQWDFDVFSYGTAVLGGMGGGTRMPEGPTKASSTISGALGGAAVGAAFGPVGAGIGAAIGGLAGYLQ